MEFNSAFLAAVLLFLGAAFLVWLSFQWSVPVNFPPGPKAWPLIGHLPFLARHGENLPETLTELSKVYGPIIGLKVAWQNFIFINSYGAAKEAFIDNFHDFAGRPDFLYVMNRILSADGKVRGPLFSNGKIWKNVRHFCLTSMRTFGLGKEILENKIKEEVKLFFDTLEQNVNNGDGDIQELLFMATSNIMCSVNFGHRFKYSDGNYKKMINIVKKITGVPFISPVNIFPFMRHSPTSKWLWDVLKNKKELDIFIENEIETRRNKFNGQEPSNLIEMYLEKERAQDSENDRLSLCDLKRCITDLFIAGVDTVGTAFLWFLLHMLHYPQVLKKCQDELETVISKDADTVSMSDLQNLPYTNAVLHETQRCTSLSALGITRSPKVPTTLSGYDVPKYTIVIPNVHAIHHDDSVWKNPDEFKPGRWLDENGMFQKHHGFVLFGFPPRTCLGKILARQQLFLFTAILLRKYNICSADAEIPPLKGTQKILFSPPSFRIKISPKNY